MEDNTISRCRTVQQRIQDERVPMQIFISPNTREWLGNQYIHIMMSRANMGRATVVRAILDAFRAEGVDFADCLTELDIRETVRAMIRPTAEVKG